MTTAEKLQLLIALLGFLVTVLGTLLGWAFVIGMGWQLVKSIRESIEKLETLYTRVGSLEARQAATEQRCVDRGEAIEQIRSGMKTPILLLLLGAGMVAAGLLGSCAGWAPRSELRSTSWEGATTHSQVIYIEQGLPLLYGERRGVVATPGTYAAQETSKRSMGTVAGAIGGGVIGWLTGQPALGMLVGSGAGAMGQALERKTTDTLPASPWAVQR